MSIPLNTVVDITINVTGSQGPRFSFGSLLGVFAHTVNAARQNGPYSTITEVNDAGFTAAAEPAVNAWATAVFNQNAGVGSIIIGLKAGGDANYTVTMDAIETDGPNGWYITNIESRLDADIALVQAWTEPRTKIFCFQSDDKAATAMLAAQALSSLRTFGIYHKTDALYADGAWSSRGGGFDLDAPDGAGSWFGKELTGIVPDDRPDLTQVEGIVITDAGGNLYTTTNRPFTAYGTMAGGRFIDLTTTIDWLAVRSEETLIDAFVDVPTKIPYTQSGINQLAAAWQGVLNAGVTNGHLSPDDPPVVNQPNIVDIDPTDKAARRLRLTANGTLAGAIQSTVLTLNLTI